MFALRLLPDLARGLAASQTITQHALLGPSIRLEISSSKAMRHNEIPKLCMRIQLISISPLHIYRYNLLITNISHFPPGSPINPWMFLHLLAALLHRGLHTDLQPIRPQFADSLQRRLLPGHGQLGHESSNIRVEEQKLSSRICPFTALQKP